MTEESKSFEARVIQLARMLDWRVAHFRPALTKHGWRTAVSGDGKGFPDLLLLGTGLLAGRMIIAELKTGSGRLSPEQITWLSRFKAVPNSLVYVWRPEDMQQIAEVLQGLTVGVEWKPPEVKPKPPTLLDPPM